MNSAQMIPRGLVETIISTSLGPLPVWTLPGGLEGHKPIILCITGAWAEQEDMTGLPAAVAPDWDAAVMRLPGNETPELALTSVEGWSTAVDELIDTAFGDRLVIVMGLSLGGLVAIATRNPKIRRKVAVEPFLSTAKLWPMIGGLRDMWLSHPERRSVLEHVFGVSAAGVEDRSYHHLFHSVVPIEVIAGEVPLMPPREIPRFPSFLDVEDRRWLASRPNVAVSMAPGAGHNIHVFAPSFLLDRMRHLQSQAQDALGHTMGGGARQSGAAEVQTAGLTKYEFATSRGPIWLWGRADGLSHGNSAVVALNGAFAVERPRTFSLIDAIPEAAVLVGHIPGNHCPPFSEPSVGAFAEAYGEVLRQIGRPTVFVGASISGVVGMALDSAELVGRIVLDPPLRTAKLWPLVGEYRRLLKLAPDDAGLRRFLWSVMGVGEDVLEDRDYSAVLNDIAVPTWVLLGDDPLMPERAVTTVPSLVDAPERALMRGRPMIGTCVVQGAGHNVIVHGFDHTVKLIRSLFPKIEGPADLAASGPARHGG